MKLYFRRRKQGALAFRLEVENRQRRLEMIHIATITGKGEVRPHRRFPPTEAELAEIDAWITQESEGLSPAEEAIRDINLAAQWVAKDATDDEILAGSDPMLLAMHDLRHEIVRRLSKVGTGKPSDD
ncbi:MAG: hypothetical protein AAGI70_07530 [Pseudomonadota bacterium]